MTIASLSATKTCTHCKQTKPLTDFHRHKRNPDGLNYWCSACKKAHHAWKKSLIPKKPRKTLQERFEAKFNRRSEHECWEWIGSTNVNRRGVRYGEIFIRTERDKQIKVKAHRLSYTLYIGEIPEGLYVLHRCDNGVCVNPAHRMTPWMEEDPSGLSHLSGAIAYLRAAQGVPRHC